jgi:GxxExxY protein
MKAEIYKEEGYRQFRAKWELACHYKGRELKKRYIPDLFVFGFLVELKSVSQLAPEAEAQLLNYMRIGSRPATLSTSATKTHWCGSALFSPNSFGRGVSPN